MRIVVGVLLFVVALVPRVADIGVGDPQGDEVLWDARVTTFLQAVQAGDISHATSHLGHPAIPAVAAMAAARAANDSLPAAMRVDNLTADRIGNASLSALVAPVSYLCFAPLLGATWALLASILIALDPQHLAASRMAHVDSSLSLFIILSSSLYLLGQLKGHRRVVLLAGIAWGLALACRPTAICLPAAFLAFNAFRRFVARVPDARLIAWSDLWAVMLGLSTLAAVFTRFWHHRGPFFTELGVKIQLADTVYYAGRWLQHYPLLTVVALAIPVAVALRTRRARISETCAAAALLIALFTLFPAVFENYVRYTVRLFGLTEHVHRDLGTMHPWIPGGYIGVLLFQLPTAAVVLGVLGVAVITRQALRRSPGQLSRSGQALVFFAIVAVAWIGALSVSSRSYARYIVPVLPLVYIPIACGLQAAVSLFDGKPTRNLLAPFSACALGLITIWNTHPIYLNYFNDIFGGVATAAQREYPLFHEGHQEALRFIRERALTDGNTPTVAVIGELPVVERANERLASSDRASLKLSLLQFAQSADYVITTEPLRAVTERHFGQTLAGTTQLYRYERDGVVFAAVYRGDAQSLLEPQTFPLFGLRRATGGVSSEDSSLGFGEHRVLYAMPERHKAGALFTDAHLRLDAGRYVMGLSVALLREAALEPSAPVLDVRAGDECSRVITASELSGAFRFVPFSCEVQGSKSLPVSAYWHGNASLAIDTLQVVNVDGLADLE